MSEPSPNHRGSWLNRTVLGVDWGIWSMQHGTDQMALVTDLLAMISGGRLHPVRPKTYPLDQVAVALDDLLARRIVGKVALVP